MAIPITRYCVIFMTTMKHLNRQPLCGSPCCFLTLSAFPISMVATIFGICSCFPSGRVESCGRLVLKITASYVVGVLKVKFLPHSPTAPVHKSRQAYTWLQHKDRNNRRQDNPYRQVSVRQHKYHLWDSWVLDI